MYYLSYKSFFCVAVIFLAACLLSCHAHSIRDEIPLSRESMENNYFVLDFERGDADFQDLKAHFFTTFPHDDPTRGDVVYDRKQWVSSNMMEIKKGDGLYLYIKDRNDGIGFDSFRLTSKAYYNLNEFTGKLLFVFKGELPSAKGIWPAWWLNGGRQDVWTYKNRATIETDRDLDSYSGKGHFYDTPSAVNPTDWPAAGEIDIIETINGDNIIHNTIHTCPQMCDAVWNRDGRVINCSNAISGDPNSGCSGKSYKLDAPEGTFACLWSGNNIRFYYWHPGDDIRSPGGPLSDDPDPLLWPATSLMNEVNFLETDAGCNVELHEAWQCENCGSSNTCLFVNLKMIFNVTLCGKWAGNEFDSTDMSMSNCRNYILNDGKDSINNQSMKIAYVSVRKIQ